MPNTMEAPKPCPLCDGVSALHENDWCEPHEWHVYCATMECGCHGPSRLNADAAIAAWNRRAPSPSLGGEVDDAAVMRIWRECGLPEYFLGNGGSNHKLVAFAKACAALKGWLPIESAPKLGGAIINDPKWGVCEGTRFADGSWGLATFNGSTKKAHPTHWRPLPAPPDRDTGT